MSGNRAHHFMAIAGRVEDDWQLVTAASGSSIPSTSSHQAGPRSTQQQGPHHQQTSASSSVSQHQSPVKGPGDVQNFPELDRLSNEELAALLVDDTKYGSLVDSIMARSSVAQVCPFPLCALAHNWCLAQMRLTVLHFLALSLPHEFCVVWLSFVVSIATKEKSDV